MLAGCGGRRENSDGLSHLSWTPDCRDMAGAQLAKDIVISRPRTRKCEPEPGPAMLNQRQKTHQSNAVSISFSSGKSTGFTTKAEAPRSLASSLRSASP